VRSPPVERAPVLAAPAARDTTRPPAPRTGDSWLGTDKLRHFVLAGLVQGVAFGVATTAGARQRSALVAASAVTGLVSIGKEVHDRRRGGRVSGRDLAWDAAGGALWGVLLARSGR
jgi:uncharacterized protein YfiM (DUF2279 family)